MTRAAGFSPNREPVAFVFRNLPCYSREEARLATRFARVFHQEPDWIRWIQDAFGDFLERPAGFEVRLTQRHTVDRSQPEQKHAFGKSEIFIGRDEQSDVCLPIRSVGRRHARISIEDGKCVLQDLGASLGTYLNKARLAPNVPHALAPGDHFDIFPYSFEVNLRPVWVRAADVEVAMGGALPVRWTEFLESASRDRITFPVGLSPGGPVCVEAGSFFLEEFLYRLLLPLGIAPERLGLREADSGFFELLVISLLERVNSALAFPFQASPGPLGARPEYPERSRGLVFPLTVRVLGLTGAFRIFVPMSFITATGELTAAAHPTVPVAPLSWFFPVSAGHLELAAGELETLAAGDVLLYTPESEILLPNDSDRGWRLIVEPGNAAEARIDKYFERPTLVPEQSQNPEPRPGADEARADARPDLSRLPVRIHVILGEKELTLAEAGGLVRGSILDLGMENPDTVHLAVNGKTVGLGRLVEVDGKVGVRIISWSKAG